MASQATNQVFSARKIASKADLFMFIWSREEGEKDRGGRWLETGNERDRSRQEKRGAILLLLLLLLLYGGERG